MAFDEEARLLAEQTAVDCDVADVEDVLVGPAHRRLLTVLRLVGDAGEAAGLLVLGDPSPPAPDRAHELTTSLVDRPGNLLHLRFEWRTRGYAALFQVLTGHVAARLDPGGVIVSVEGLYLLGADLADRPLGATAGRRAAEVAVRAWLSQLRAALEHPASGVPSSATAPRDSGLSTLGVAPEMSPT